MGCGCKNKNNGGNNTTQQSGAQTQAAPQNQTIQESVKKIVEKYYKKK